MTAILCLSVIIIATYGMIGLFFWKVYVPLLKGYLKKENPIAAGLAFQVPHVQTEAEKRQIENYRANAEADRIIMDGTITNKEIKQYGEGEDLIQ